MPHSKTPGGAGASEKFLKQQAESEKKNPLSFPSPLPPPLFPSLKKQFLTEHGEGASNAAGHTEGKAPGEAPVRLVWSNIHSYQPTLALLNLARMHESS